MTLFRLSEIPSSKPADKNLSPKGLKNFAVSSHRLGKSLLDLQSTIGELEHDHSLQFTTAGAWSMHQLLEYILLKTGNARVWMTTWTITEEPMRALLDMIQKRMISELNAVLDYRIERRKPEAFQLANNIITRIKLTKCHAKVLVIRNETWDVTIMGSANFSKNPRIEAGVIFTDRKTAEFNAGWIDEIIEGKEVFRVR